MIIIYICILSLFKIEYFCVRLILICYVINFNFILVEVVEKVNKIEVEFFYNLMVVEFYVVIWKLIVVCMFEIMG